MNDDSLRDYAIQYFKGGWHPLELPARCKSPPPDGRTGYGGSDMTLAEIEDAAWFGNLGLRMPADVLGLDVDCYKGGGDTLRALFTRCGPLPNTWISHSGRNDGSGIRYFRVPQLVWVHALPGMEIIQRVHRYGLAFPSIHPDGRAYAWTNQAEPVVVGELPVVEDLPELPWPWIRELSRAQVHEVESGRSHATDHAGVAGFVATHTQADEPGYVSRVILPHFTERWRQGYSRHDTMQHCLLWALENVRAGVAGAGPTLDALAGLWVQAVGADARRAQLHSEHRTTEFEAMVRHAVGKVMAKGQDEINRIHDENAHIPMNVPSPEEEDEESEPEKPRFKRWSVAELLAQDRTFTWDVVGMLAQHTYGLDAGELKTLKSYFGLARDIGLAAGVPILGKWDVPERRRVLVFVAEGGRIPYTNRLERMAIAHGIVPASLEGWLTVIDDVAPLDSQVLRGALTHHLRDFQPGFVHLDPLYPFQPASVSPSQYTEVGKMLTATHRLCAEHGATFWVTAHMNQSGGGFDLKRVSGAGHGEWGDSWALLRHRDQPDVDAGRFRLGLALGSRQWGGTTWDLDLNIGRFDPELGLHDGPISWEVRPATAAPITETEAIVSEETMAEIKLEVLRVGHFAKVPLSRTEWLARVKRRHELKRAAFDELVRAGDIRQASSGRVPTYEDNRTIGWKPPEPERPRK